MLEKALNKVLLAVLLVALLERLSQAHQRLLPPHHQKTSLPQQGFVEQN
jgi:hypothetical protein